MERSTANKQASAARKPAPPVVRSAPKRSTPTQALQQRLGNRGAQRAIARSADVAQRAAAATKQQATTALPSAMRGLRISQPADPAEREATSVARHIVSLPQPASHVANSTHPKHDAIKDAQSVIAAAPAQPSLTGAAGNPLPTSVSRYMEPRFGAQFGNVRIHTNQAAARQSAAIGAHAFTVGGHIYFGKDQFQPQTTRGRELIAHELAHTIQQGASAQRDTAHRSAAVSIQEHSEPALQRSGFDLLSPRQSLANYAANVPGYTLLSVLLGKNPISGVDVARNPANLLRGVIQLLPMGKLISDALDRYGLIVTTATWIAAQLEPLQAIAHEVRKFIDGVSFSDLLNLEANWDRGVALLKSVEQRVTQFVLGLVRGMVTLIKEAVLKPLAEFAKTTRGYPLLCVILKQDPITKEAVPATPETLLGSFLKFINEEETWNTMQQAKAVPRVYVWFQNAVGVLQSMVVAIPGMFIQAFQSLSLLDILNIPGAFVRLANIFGSFGAQFINWGATAVWTLLEIIFDVVSPGALAYIKRTGAALRSIFRNPLPFMNNLVRAAKAGFLNFADNFLTHLKSGLINWLTGSLPGVYIPKAFTLMEIARFVFSALRLTWSNIRIKLVKAVGETAVKALETSFDIVVTLVRDGPIAAWDLIKSELDKFQEMVIGGITDFIVDTVVKKAIPKLMAMFIPGVGFVSAIITIYDTVMVFVNKISQMVEVVKGFVDSIIAIAAGNIGSAAKRVETTLAGGLSLAINFLAGFVGLGKVADKVMGVINKIRASIDKALDKVVAWIAKMAKKLVGKAKAGAKKAIDKAKKLLGIQKRFTSTDGVSHRIYIVASGATSGLMIASAPSPLRNFLAKTKPLATGDLKAVHDAAVRKADQFELLKPSLHSEKTVPTPEQMASVNSLLEDLSRDLAKLVPLVEVKVESNDLVGRLKKGTRIKLLKQDQKASVISVDTFQGHLILRFKVPRSRGRNTLTTLSVSKFRIEWDFDNSEFRPKNPKRDGKVGKAVIERMASAQLYDRESDSVKFSNLWYLRVDCDLSHVVDAVHFWNTIGRFDPDAMDDFMKDPKNYILEPKHTNQARGRELAARGVKYQGTALD